MAKYATTLEEVLTLRSENAELRKALAECEDTLRLVEHPRRVDPDYGAEVEALGRRIGFGALMSSAQASWRAVLLEKGNPVGGEFVAGPCYATVLRALQMVRAALNQQFRNIDAKG